MAAVLLHPPTPKNVNFVRFEWNLFSTHILLYWIERNTIQGDFGRLVCWHPNTNYNLLLLSRPKQSFGDLLFLPRFLLLWLPNEVCGDILFLLGFLLLCPRTRRFGDMLFLLRFLLLLFLFFSSPEVCPPCFSKTLLGIKMKLGEVVRGH